MVDFHFTGSPFVDAGIAALCAAAEVETPDQLDELALRKATETLLSLFTGEAAFQKRLIGMKTSIFATSEMSVIFPNGPHSNPAVKPENKPREYRARVTRKAQAVLNVEIDSNNVSSCAVYGRKGVFFLGNDEYPLADSKGKRNFHPGHQAGQAVSAEAALALEFFPLSVLRSGKNQGVFWFVHTANAEIAIDCAHLTLQAMQNAIARKEGLGFFGGWEIGTKNPEAAMVALIRKIVGGGGAAELNTTRLNASELPITAYVFSNDNRSPTLAAYDLPHELFRFFRSLKRVPSSSPRFQVEVLQSDRICWKVTPAMIGREPIVRQCVVLPKGEYTGRLLGGWPTHSLYATEVLGMSGYFIRAVEAVSERIVASELVSDFVLILQKFVPTSALLRLVKEGVMTNEEYTILLTPEERTASAARDYLLAAVYERQDSLANNRSFVSWPGNPLPTRGAKPALLELVERVGSALITADYGNRAVAQLASARRTAELRGVALRFCRRGEMTWNDFLMFFPPEEERASKSLVTRDYLLAFLYDRLRNTDLPEPPPGREN